MELIGFFSIWYELGRWRQIRKFIGRISATMVCQKIPERMGAMSDGGAEDPCLHRVFSPSLDAEKNWYALNGRLCCGKPSVFCCTDAAKMFNNEFKQLSCNDVFGQDGAPAPMSWFSADGRRCEYVYVCSLFGLMLGILRQKSLRQVPFLRTNKFQEVVEWINLFGLAPKSNSPRISPPTIASKSPPIQKGTTLKRGRPIEEIREQDLSPAYKKRKIREVALELKSEIDSLCQQNGQSLSTVMEECCRRAGEGGLEARGIFTSLMDTLVEEKGAHAAFSRLISEESWNKRLEDMRVPDWVYLLLKLRARISDRGWQDLTNLTQLGRTGVS